ncbi:hypothetical protein EIN_243560 [Entamoeba invadens IP1]|uniref:EGF-like domain-containing protein n=1 Tax=Entamoeba invadens IP1 TaxID=370355 RepID=L7FPI4_ENTIV|nr:hypothetical protein EIN_243560 [Entamoeba invadens IP1]ELP94580.1 hypothetical protein EIN_243560 [Entamoeba invadens IP1]|eukprot:XP_004261351.1 hypothetical protein EIN_243560 [Entamoeba invadens IP1]
MKTLIFLSFTVFTAFSNNCDPPVENCLTCKKDLPNQCEMCDLKYYLNNKKCEVKSCKACRTNCAECTNATSCTQCTSGYYLNEKQSCEPCQSNCAECTDADDCINCNNGFYLNGNTCTKCTTGCSVCSDATECSSCSDGYYLEVSNCKAEAECSATAIGCSKCKADQTTCLSCTVGYYLKSGSCIKCTIGCSVCSDASTCSSCSDGYYLKGEICTKCGSNCIQCSDAKVCSKCDPNFVGYISSEGVCTACNVAYNCATCIEDTTDTNGVKCLTCNEQTKNKYMNGNKCVDCANGKITSDKKCDTSENACGSGCAACEEVAGSSTTKCTKCTKTTDYVNLDGTCDSTCKIGKANKDIMTCEECTINDCETCETVGTAEQCTKCGTKYISTDKLSCGDLCTVGKPVETPVKKCDICATANCDVCDKKDKCTQCKNNFYLVPDTSKCVEKCPEGYMTDKTKKKCIKCTIEGCAICEKVDECTTCMAEYKLEGGKCNGDNAVYAILAIVMIAFLL